MKAGARPDAYYDMYGYVLAQSRDRKKLEEVIRRAGADGLNRVSLERLQALYRSLG